MRNRSGHLPYDILYFVPYEGFEKNSASCWVKVAEESLLEEECFSTKPRPYRDNKQFDEDFPKLFTYLVAWVLRYGGGFDRSIASLAKGKGLSLFRTSDPICALLRRIWNTRETTPEGTICEPDLNRFPYGSAQPHHRFEPLGQWGRPTVRSRQCGARTIVIIRCRT